MLQVGFATRDITPTDGKIIPGGFSPRPSKGCLDPLLTTACLIRNEEQGVAIIGVDAVSLSTATADSMRAAIAARLGLQVRHIVIAASHTHGGGPTNDVLGCDADAEYVAFCIDQITQVAVDAHDAMEEACCAHPVGRCEGLAFNRRFKMRDGSEATQPARQSPEIVAPAGPTDPELSLIAFRGKGGSLLGTIAGFTCHPTVIWDDRFTGDYPAYWRSALRERLHPDFHMVFLNGACGDIGPVDFASAAVRQSGVEWARHMGSVLADETIRLLGAAEYADTPALATAHGEVRVAFRHPYPEQLEAARALVAADAPWVSKTWQARDLLLLAEQLGDAQDTACQVDAIAIGEAVVAAAPWQPFCEFGLKIKRSFPDRPVLLATFANGMIGYVPTPAAFIGGGYEPTLCRGSKLTPDAGAKITEALIQTVGQLT